MIVQMPSLATASTFAFSPSLSPPAPVPRLYGRTNDDGSGGIDGWAAGTCAAIVQTGERSEVARLRPELAKMEELRRESSKAIADLTSTLESEREGHGNHLAATANFEDQAETKA